MVLAAVAAQTVEQGFRSSRQCKRRSAPDRDFEPGVARYPGRTLFTGAAVVKDATWEDGHRYAR